MKGKTWFQNVEGTWAHKWGKLRPISIPDLGDRRHWVLCVIRSSSGLFSVDWLSDGSVALCAANGRYVTARMNGSLNAVADAVTSDRERFHVTIINRAQLVLRCEYGFVGFRSDAHPRIECNKTTYDVISVEHSGGENAEYMYFLKGQNDTRCLFVSQWDVVADANRTTPFPFS